MRLPTSPAAIRIAHLFRRRLTTQWSEKEARQMRKLNKAHYFDSLDDLALVERYYAFEFRKGDRGCHRRDLATFVNNYAGEVDRAKGWEETHPAKPKPRKIIPMPPFPSDQPFVPLTGEETAAVARFNAGRAARKGEGVA